MTESEFVKKMRRLGLYHILSKMPDDVCRSLSENLHNDAAQGVFELLE